MSAPMQPPADGSTRSWLAWLGLLLCLAVPLAPTGALAHKVSVYAMVEGDSVRAEAYFADGSPCVGAVVAVFDTSGEELASATTDSLGQVAFARLRDDGLKLVVVASMGHRDEFMLTAEELGGRDSEDASPASPRPQGPAQAGGVGTPAAAGVQVAVPNAALVRQLEASLDRRLAPLETAVRRLVRAQERADLKDAVAGVGFIVGLAGLWAFLSSRRKQGL